MQTTLTPIEIYSTLSKTQRKESSTQLIKHFNNFETRYLTFNELTYNQLTNPLITVIGLNFKELIGDLTLKSSKLVPTFHSTVYPTIEDIHLVLKRYSKYLVVFHNQKQPRVEKSKDLTPEDIMYNMRMLESKVIYLDNNDDYAYRKAKQLLVIRVPGGWTVKDSTDHKTESTTVFVPYVQQVHNTGCVLCGHKKD